MSLEATNELNSDLDNELSSELDSDIAADGVRSWPAWKKRSCIGLAVALFPTSAIGIPLALNSDTQDSEVIALVAAEIEETDVPVSQLEINSDIALDKEEEIEAPTTEPEEDSTTTEVAPRKFSANRAACLRLYNDPTADVAFQVAPVEETLTTDSTLGADTSQNTETSITTVTVPKETTVSVAETPAPTASETSTTVATTPSTEAPTTAAPVTAPAVAPPAPPGWADAGNGVNVPIVLLAIRCCESRNNYLATNSKSTASGAYQFLDGTWAGAFGVKRAMWATPAQQDLQAIDEWERNGTRPWNASKHCWGQDA